MQKLRRAQLTKVNQKKPNNVVLNASVLSLIKLVTEGISDYLFEGIYVNGIDINITI